MSNLGLLQVWYDRVWEQEDIDAVDELLAPEATITGLEEGAFHDADAFRLFWRFVFSFVEDIRPVIQHHVSEGEWIAAVVKLDAKIRPTGGAFSVKSHVMVRFVDGKIAEGDNLVDFVDAFQQLGVMPPRTLDHCLLGRKLSFS